MDMEFKNPEMGNTKYRTLNGTWVELEENFSYSKQIFDQLNAQEKGWA